MGDMAEDIYELSGLIDMYQATGEVKYRQAADAAFWRLESGEEKSELAMPFYAEYDTLFGQKAHYGEIAVFFEEKGTWSGRDAAALIDTIEKMSMEIYEYYRALCDLFKRVIRSEGWLELRSQESPVSQDEAFAGYAVLKACNLGVLNCEKYGAAGITIWKRFEAQERAKNGTGSGTGYGGADESNSRIRNMLQAQYLILEQKMV